MSIAKIQTGDSVKVTSGNFKNTIGVVIKVAKTVKSSGKISTRAAVNVVPTIVKYRKSQVHQGEKYPGMMKQVSRMIDISNLALITPDQKVSKVSIKVVNGKKTRVYKLNGNPVEKVKIESIINSDSNLTILENIESNSKENSDVIDVSIAPVKDITEGEVKPKIVKAKKTTTSKEA